MIAAFPFKEILRYASLPTIIIIGTLNGTELLLLKSFCCDKSKMSAVKSAHGLQYQTLHHYTQKT